MTPQWNDDQEYEQRRKHIEALEERIAGISGMQGFAYFSPDCPDEIRETFLEHVLAYEEEQQRPLFDELVKNGIALPPPDELDDRQVSAKLWEVIHGMSLFGHYLSNTNHLSDRELYHYLWTEALPAPTTFMLDNPRFACHIDPIGSGSEADIRLYLKYYADEEYRQSWAADWPDDPIPPHEDPPYDRDRDLPQPPCEASASVHGDN